MKRWAGTIAVFVLCTVHSLSTVSADSVSSMWKVTRQVRAGSMPWSVTVAPDGSQLWVSMVGYKNRDNVWRYDANSLTVEAKSSFRGHGVESELIEDGKRLLVTNSRRDLLMELDATTLSVQRSIQTDRIPKDLDMNPERSIAYIANYGAGSLSAIQVTDGHSTHVKTGSKSRGATIAPDGTQVYVMNFGEGTVAVVDTETLHVTARIPACANPRHGVVVRQHLWVTCYGARHIVVIDRKSRRVARRIKVGRGPKTIALAPDESFAVTANEKADSISIVDTAGFRVQTLPVPGRKPCGVAVGPDAKHIYVTARGSHELIELTRQK